MRRALKTRSTIKKLEVVRLSIHKTSNHIYAQLIAPDNTIIAVASSLDKELGSLTYGGNVKAAVQVGQLIGRKGKKVGISHVAFDRSGFRYHGRIKALADAARESGLEF